jgi:hypothetical protein
VIPQVAAIALMLGTSCFAASAGKSLVSISHFGTLASSLRLTGRKPNTQGSVFVAEYHRIQQGRGDMFRSPADFAKDLENYYAAGFRPVLASEYLSNRMRLPSGTSPIVITFDDSIASQIQMRDDGSVTPDCAVGIWQAFARSHPDFPVHATFFVLPDVMWGQKKLVNQKIQWLFHAGSELANHTTTHPKLSHLSDEKVKWELGNASEKLEAEGQKGPHSMALPYGINPKNKSILNGFDWKGRHITFTGVFLVGANPAPSPNSTKFNRLRVPRILAISGPYGIDFWLQQLKQGRVKPFVQP